MPIVARRRQRHLPYQNDQGYLSLQASYGLPDEYAHGLHLPPEASPA